MKGIDMHGSGQHRGVVSRPTGGIRAVSRNRCSLAAALMLAALFASVFVSSGATAAPLRVCATGCQYTTIAGALADARDGDKIFVDGGTYAGALSIANDVVLRGAGAGKTTITAGGAVGAGSVVTVAANVTANISGVTITGGFAQLGAGVRNEGDLTLKGADVVENNGLGIGAGGTIYNGSAGVLTLIDTQVADNMVVDGVGGGIDNRGSALLIGSVVRRNAAEFVGAGLYNDLDASMTLMDTTVSNNFSGMAAGGIENRGTLTLRRSSVTDNTAQTFGGGILNNGLL
jgi:hypothetical protein